jgi:hypothetical protein
MFLILLGQDGTRLDAILLSAGQHRMRVAIPGSSDASDFWFNDKTWVSEDGSPFEIEAMILDGRVDREVIGFHFQHAA